MKSVITAICLLIPLVIIFVIIDRKEFYSGDNVAIQQEIVTRKPITETTLKPVETKLVETKPVEVKPVAETKPNNPTETKPVAETKAEEKLVPAAIPVVTAEGAAKLNAEAIEYSKPRMIVADHLRNGYKNVYSANFQRLVGINLSGKQEQALQEKGYDIHEFKTRLVPDSWTIDFSSVPSDIIFQKIDDGYNLSSQKESLLIQAPKYDSMGSSFFIDAIVKNNSDEEDCELKVGVYSTGILNKGHTVSKSCIIAPGKETSIQWEISVYDHYSSFSPTISTKGNVILKSFDVYRLNHADITIVQGTVKERSVLPDPQATDYPDCRYTARFVGESIVNGKPCNKEIVLSVDGFKDKKVLASNSIRENDKIKCAIVRFDSVPEELSGIQEADDLNLFELDSYLVTSYEKISSFVDYSEISLEINFADFLQGKSEYISIFDREINPGMPEDLRLAQKAMIERDLKRINEMLLPYTEEKKNEINLSFIEAWTKEKEKDPPNYNRIGKNVWRNVDNSFYSLPEYFSIIQDYPLVDQDNLVSLIAFKDYLETQGIQLIISIVPVSYDISARVINKDFRNLPDFRTACLVRQLLENGIEAIYSSDVLISKYNMYENPFYYPGDPHPCDLPQDVLSDLLSERLSRFNFERQLERSDFKVIRTTNTYKFASLENRTFQNNCDIGDHKPGDPYTISKIFYRDQEVKNETNSPVIVLGNSYSTVPEPISCYLCMKTGIGIYHYSVAGIGVLSTAFQRIFNSPEKYLKDRRVFILALGTIHLLNNVPIPNLRDLDLGAIVMQNLKPIKEFEVNGKETKIPEFAVQLSNPSIYGTDTDGNCSILKDENIATSSFDESKEHYLVFTYCCETNDHFELQINDSTFPLSGNDHSYMWIKKVVPIPIGTNVLNVSVKARKNSFIAIGGIQLYQ